MKTLKYWYLEKYQKGEQQWVLAHGIVSGHNRLADGTPMHTSYVKEVRTEGDTAVLVTRNSEYVCRLDTARFDRFDEEGRRLVLDFDQVEKKYRRRPLVPGERDGVVFLLDRDAEYQFVAAALVLDGKRYEKETAAVHPGMFQDSVLVSWHGLGSPVDYRYFPNDPLEFYSWTDTLDVFLENAGDVLLRVLVHGQEYEIPPARTLAVRRRVYEEDQHRKGGEVCLL